MLRKLSLTGRAIALALAITLAITLAIALAGGTARAQDGDDDLVVTIVGGEDQPQTYPDQTVAGVTFNELRYRSNYPGGMEFRAVITPPEGQTISQVTLFYAFPTGKASRVPAEPGDQPNEWVARPYEGRGLPPWHEVEAYWGVRGPDGFSVDSAPVHAVYYDATREWLRAESEDVLVYWYGMPETLGRYVLDAMAQNRDTYAAGFGERLPYRPMAVIFPPGPDWNEYKGDSSIDDTEQGFTGTIISEAGSTIQRVRTEEPAAIRADCIWNPAESTLDFRLLEVASTTSHEVAHLYQQELGVGRGPTWWIEGQARFFETHDEYPVDDRLRTLAQMRGGELPSFQGSGPSGGALTAEEDGCTHLIYDMGASFMRWIVREHGGIETYRAVVEAMQHNATLFEALEEATGVPMLELENGWRASLGVGPVPQEVLDPAAALSEPNEPFFEVGESVLLPGTPFQQPILERPSTAAPSTGACFANTPVTILDAGSDGTLNWYQVDCLGMVGWMNQGQMTGP